MSRSMSREELLALIPELSADRLAALTEAGAVRPIVQGSHPLDRAADAHRELEASGHIGKILLTA